MAFGSAGPSTIFASIVFHRPLNAVMPSAVIRSTTCDGTSAGGIFGSGGCGACGACPSATIAIMQITITIRLVLLVNKFLKPLPFISLHNVKVALGIGRDVVGTI